jgi:hypothetical protein
MERAGLALPSGIVSEWKDLIMSSTLLNQQPATQALRQSPIPALRRLTLEENGTAVVIQGHVSSYYLKQLAQETILPVLDGRELVNRVLVVHEAVLV